MSNNDIFVSVTCTFILGRLFKMHTEIRIYEQVKFVRSEKVKGRYESRNILEIIQNYLDIS